MRLSMSANQIDTLSIVNCLLVKMNTSLYICCEQKVLVEGRMKTLLFKSLKGKTLLYDKASSNKRSHSPFYERKYLIIRVNILNNLFGFEAVKIYKFHTHKEASL